MPTAEALSYALKDFYGRMVIQMAVEGTALANGNNYLTQAERNAIVHAHVSASTAYVWGDKVAEAVGYAKELPADPAHLADTLKDQYNERKGAIAQQSGAYVEESVRTGRRPAKPCRSTSRDSLP